MLRSSGVLATVWRSGSDAVASPLLTSKQTRNATARIKPKKIMRTAGDGPCVIIHDADTEETQTVQILRALPDERPRAAGRRPGVPDIAKDAATLSDEFGHRKRLRFFGRAVVPPHRSARIQYVRFDVEERYCGLMLSQDLLPLLCRSQV